MESKTCRNCGPLPLSHFFPSSRLLLCKSCQNEKRTKHRQSNPTQARVVQRRAKLKKKYGITLEDYARMVKAQKGCCAICREKGDTNPESMMRLGVDHCHVTGRVRGLLCRPCNRAIGIFKDDPKLCHRAGDYLNSV